MAVIKQAGFHTSDEAFKLYTPIVKEIFDEGKLDTIASEDVSGKLGFIEEEVYNYHGQIQTKLWVMGSGFVGELDTFKINTKNYWPKLSYHQYNYPSPRFSYWHISRIKNVIKWFSWFIYVY